jgi:hypothetical protein
MERFGDFYTFFTSSERFKAAQESKQNFYILKNYIKTKPKRFKLRQAFKSQNKTFC